MTLSDVSDDFPPNPNVVIKLSVCLYLYHEMNVDDDKYLYHKLIDITCMFRIGCKPIYANYFNRAKTCLKVIKASCCRLMNLLPLETLACLGV
jgi:hypothetical protein